MEEFEVEELDDGNLLLTPIDDDDDLRNAHGGRGRGRSRGRGRGRGRGGRGRGGSSFGNIQRADRREQAPIVRPDTGGLSTGNLINAAAQVLAAMTSLPPAPKGSGDPAKDVVDLIEYQTLLAQHAKRDEQLRTVGSLVASFVR